MTRDGAAREARREVLAAADRAVAQEMSARLARQAHDDAHARMAARLAGDAGSGAILLLAAAVPLILGVVFVLASLAGAVAGIADAGGTQ